VSLVRWDETLAARSSTIRVSFRTIKREVFLDTIIFVLIFFTLLAMRTRRRWLVLTLYFASLAATMLLFNHHVTSELDLNF
jgi:hypothetical protein